MKTLPYWIENNVDGNLYIWTKISIPANSTKIICIKKEEGHQPDGTKVFEFFEDFDKSLDTKVWKTHDCDINVQNSVITLHCDTNYGGIHTDILNLTGKYAIEFTWLKKTSGWVASFNPNDNVAYLEWGYSNDKKIYHDRGDWHQHYFTEGPLGVWKKISYVVDTENNRYKLYDNNILKVDWSDGNLINSLKGVEFRSANFSSGIMQIDYIFIRKYVDCEPLISTVQIDNNSWLVIVNNINDYDLYDYQIRINGKGIIDDKKCSLLLTVESYKIVTKECTLLFLRDGYVTIKDLNKHRVTIRYIITFNKTTSNFHICDIGNCHIYIKHDKLYIDDEEIILKDKNQIIIDVVKNNLINVIINDCYTKTLPFDKVKIGNNVDVSIKVVTIIK